VTTRVNRLALGAALALALGGCASMGSSQKTSAVASLEPTQGNAAKGTATFTQEGDLVHVRASFTGLKADGVHAFHVHEKGDCTSGDGMSAGGHYNPAAKAHGPQDADHHAGDMPNVRADAYGNASTAFVLKGVTVGGDAGIVGKGLIVHRDADDYKSQPAGNAGPRIACAVIRSS
jgi:Cu-Zn family superoxide dismutase